MGSYKQALSDNDRYTLAWAIYLILLCNEYSIYFFAGCYRFTDGSFMRYLTYETNPDLTISAPIFTEKLWRYCNVGNKFKFIRDGQQWKDGEDIPFTIANDTNELKV